MGVFGYLFFHPDHGLSGLEAKLTGEWFLFAALCTALVLVLIAAQLLRAAPRIDRELDRIHRTGPQLSLTAQLQAGKLGPIRGSLLRLYSRIAELNEKQSLKMSAQHSLLLFLSSNMKAPILITDIAGRILYVSAALEKAHDLSHNSLLGSSVETFAPNILIQNILEEVETRSSYGKERKGDLSFTVFPVYNRLRQIDYLVFDFRKDSPIVPPARGEER
jgi:PAS domain-containing protein